ncbi:uncharacterized protein KRP23_12015 [Phytophthora ramorum]|uniref:uncharacterized protein n=1 Tax=Phytophthora ramorum TaxID=164328 RepID=UPI0030962C6F|nr:hypothetical protein KRP23_12015 [Phytophthora ramorum]
METGNTAGEGSPRAHQQSGSFQRQGSGVDERIRSASGSFAAPDENADDDASMSNDESMSSSSSLDIEGVQIWSAAATQIHDRICQTAPTRSTTSRGNFRTKTILI